jgi:hypothetical protein
MAFNRHQSAEQKRTAWLRKFKELADREPSQLEWQNADAYRHQGLSVEEAVKRLYK